MDEIELKLDLSETAAKALEATDLGFHQGAQIIQTVALPVQPPRLGDVLNVPIAWRGRGFGRVAEHGVCGEPSTPGGRAVGRSHTRPDRGVRRRRRCL